MPRQLHFKVSGAAGLQRPLDIARDAEDTLQVIPVILALLLQPALEIKSGHLSDTGTPMLTSRASNATYRFDFRRLPSAMGLGPISLSGCALSHLLRCLRLSARHARKYRRASGAASIVSVRDGSAGFQCRGGRRDREGGDTGRGPDLAVVS